MTMIDPDQDQEISEDEFPDDRTQPTDRSEPDTYSEDDGPPRNTRDWLSWLRQTIFGH